MVTKHHGSGIRPESPQYRQSFPAGQMPSSRGLVVPHLMGFEDADTLAAFIAPPQPATVNGQPPISPRFIGFEDAGTIVASPTPELPVTTSRQLAVKSLFFSLGLHLALALGLFGKGSVPRVVVAPSIIPIGFEQLGVPALSARAAIFEGHGFAPEEGRSGIDGPHQLKSDFALAGERRAGKKSAAPSHKATQTSGSLADRNYSAPLLDQTAYEEYLIYLIRHIGLLPLEVVGNRYGETRIGVFIRDDGAIMRVVILQSSGYSDLDLRVQKMVAAVERLPPLAQHMQRPGAQFELTVNFKFGTPPAP
jgi:TonB family protein